MGAWFTSLIIIWCAHCIKQMTNIFVSLESRISPICSRWFLHPSRRQFLLDRALWWHILIVGSFGTADTLGKETALLVGGVLLGWKLFVRVVDIFFLGINWEMVLVVFVDWVHSWWLMASFCRRFLSATFRVFTFTEYTTLEILECYHYYSDVVQALAIQWVLKYAFYC